MDEGRVTVRVKAEIDWFAVLAAAKLLEILEVKGN